MLDELKIASVGGIENADLTFSEGLTVVTGESGAGKSSLVRGLELVCGKRSRTESIRAGDETASVEAFFYVPDEISGLDADFQPQDGSLSLRRELSRTGRGRCAIQRRTAPLSTLTETASRLMSIQSQFAQLELLDPQRQLDILDSFGGEKLIAARRRLETLFNALIDGEKELRRVKAHEAEVLEKYGSLEELTPLLENISLSEASEERLESDYEETERELGRLRALHNCAGMLGGGEGSGLVGQLTNVLAEADENLSGEAKNSIAEMAERAVSLLEDIADRLSDAATSERISDLEAGLEETEENLGRLRKCKRLAGVSSCEELAEWWQKGREETERLRGLARLRAELKEKIEAGGREIVKEAKNLRELRRAAAEGLRERVGEKLGALAMGNADFRIKLIESNKLRSHGTETCEFVLVRAGKEIPVAKAASGGELSRILLAIQTSLPDGMLPPTLVFDEVEAGLGGRAAYLAGLELKKLADRAQVILITHEASIAALAGCHYRVERTGAESRITRLSDEERVGEIARMLSGDPDDEEARTHARKLLGAQTGGQLFFDPDNIFGQD